MVPEIIILALDYYRAPLRFPHLVDPTMPLPDGFDNLVNEIGNAISPQNMESTARALGLKPRELEEALLFFLRQVLLAPGSSHYRVLGLSRDASCAAIRRHYHLLLRIFHPDRLFGDAERNAACAARINESYRVLKDPANRRKYDLHLRSSRKTGSQERSVGRLVGSNEPLRLQTSLQYRKVRSHVFFRRRLGVLILFGAGTVAVIAIVVIFATGNPPALRASPHLADESVTVPSFLRKPQPPHIAAIAHRDEGPEQNNDTRVPQQHGLPTAVPVSKEDAAATAAAEQ